MSADAPKYQPQASQMFGVGEHNTLNFNTLNLVFSHLPDDDQMRLLQDKGISPAEFEALITRAINETGSPGDRDKLKRFNTASDFPQIRNAAYVATRASEPDLVDYAAQLRERQKIPGDPLYRAERDEPVYVPLPLTFSLFRQISAQQSPNPDAEFDDIVEAVQAPQPPPDSGPYPALLLLGVPGGGKSTALRHLAHNRLNWLREHPADHVPLFVSLGEYHERALDNLRRALPGDDLPLTPRNFLRAHWHSWLGGDDFGRELRAGRIWLILDGLNEIPGGHDRILEWSKFFDPDEGEFCAPNRAVIACRKADYQNWLKLPYLDLKLLDTDHIREFVKRRLEGMGPRTIDDVLRRLANDERLFEVVSNPFWLKMLTDYVEQHRGSLPSDLDRTELIDWFVTEWFRHEPGRADLKLSPEQIQPLQKALQPFACWLLARGDNPTEEWEEAARHCGEWKGFAPDDVLRRAEKVSLLVREPTGIRFYHQLILEYFAGRELARHFRHHEDETEHWRIPWSAWQFVNTAWQRLREPPTTRWEEATVFAAARHDELDDKAFDFFVRAVLAEHPPLAARCLLETGRKAPDDLRQDVIERLLALVERRDPALQSIAQSSARLSLRIAAGHALGKLGDPRIVECGFRNWEGSAQASGDIQFIEPRWRKVSAGPFTMGSNSGYDDEKPEHKCDVIKRDYAIGMFPVTNAEYECFVKAGGYDCQDYWTPAGWDWRTQDISTAQPPGWVFWRRDRIREMLDEIRQWPARGTASPSEVEFYEAESQRTDEELIANWRRRELSLSRARNPWRDDRDLNGANQPVVGVCWYEAMAYCAWLTAVLRAAGRIRADQEVTLPNEPEWEKATLPISNLQSLISNYPWGNDFDPERANTLEGRVLTTTPVGVYDNASGCGALDMSGNVWEWTRSRWGGDPQRPAFGYPYSKDLAERERLDADDYRVLRGGSWGVDQSVARVTSRGRLTPVYRYGSAGYRCVLQFLA